MGIKLGVTLHGKEHDYDPSVLISSGLCTPLQTSRLDRTGLCCGLQTCLLSHMQSQPGTTQFSSARPHLHSQPAHVTTSPSLLVIRVDSGLCLCIKIEAQAVVTRLSTRRPFRPIVVRAASDSSEAVDTSIQGQVDAVRGTLVGDVEEEAHVVGVVVGGEVIALGNVHALVVGAETFESVVGEGDLGGCRGGVTDYARDAHARSEPACAGTDGACNHRLAGILVSWSSRGWFGEWKCSLK